jgi:diguanylate cyclase (GGDEF)-like protein
VGEEPQARWLSCSSISATQLTPTLGGAWAELDSLPLLSEFPQRQLAVASRQVQQPDDSPSLAIFPLTSNAGSSAVLEINTDAPLAKESLQLVNGVLRLYLNFQSLLDYGERDALTDLLNRKTFDGAFMKATLAQQQLIEPDPDGRRNTANVASYWLAMIDIDHFKRVNDNYGHLIGDEVLLLLARLMRSSFRFHDQLYRFGGEEFVVLMRCHGEAEARIALERLRAETENHLFPQVGMITISTGFSEVKTGDTPSAAFERADKAVYYAKAHGRNQVCSYAALVASGDLTDKSEDSGELELF